MKVLVALLSLVAVCVAGDAPYKPEAQRGLLVLPKQGPTNATSTTPRPQNDNKENLDEVNSRIMERLRQQQGSEQGVYHVYLQDGRLQRVQYTTAPIRPEQQAQQQQEFSSNYKQQQQTPEILSPANADKRGVYFVQVPQERIQAYQAQSQQSFAQNFQNSQAFTPAQYNQQPDNQVNVRYLPLEATPNNQFGASSYSQPASYSSQYRQAQGEPSGYLASVQYSEVEPIQGPVYSYKPEPLTRILRYAPVF